MGEQLSVDRATRIVKAVKELYEALYDVWINDDRIAHGAALVVLRAWEDDTIRDRGVKSMSGTAENQGDVIMAVDQLLRGTFDIPDPGNRTIIK